MNSSDAPLNPADWLEVHGNYVFRYAMKHLRNTAPAEDVVEGTHCSLQNAKRPSIDGRF